MLCHQISILQRHVILSENFFISARTVIFSSYRTQRSLGNENCIGALYPFNVFIFKSLQLFILSLCIQEIIKTFEDEQMCIRPRFDIARNYNLTSSEIL